MIALQVYQRNIDVTSPAHHFWAMLDSNPPLKTIPDKETQQIEVLGFQPQKNLPQIMHMLNISNMLKKTHVLFTSLGDSTGVFGPSNFLIAAQVLSHALHEFQRREEVCIFHPECQWPPGLLHV